MLFILIGVGCGPTNTNQLRADATLVVAEDLLRSVGGPAVLRGGITVVNAELGPLPQLMEELLVVCPGDTGPIEWVGRFTQEAFSRGRRDFGVGPCLGEDLVVAAELVPLTNEACPDELTDAQVDWDALPLAGTFDETFERSRECYTAPVEVTLWLDASTSGDGV